MVNMSEGQRGRSGAHKGAAHRPTHKSRVNESCQQRFALYPTLCVFKREAELPHLNHGRLRTPY